MYDFHSYLLRGSPVAAAKEGKLPYALTRCRVSHFVVPLRGRMQTLSRVRNPSDVTPSTGDASPFSFLVAALPRPCETLSKTLRPRGSCTREGNVSRSVSDTALGLVGTS